MTAYTDTLARWMTESEYEEDAETFRSAVSNSCFRVARSVARDVSDRIRETAKDGSIHTLIVTNELRAYAEGWDPNR